MIKEAKFINKSVSNQQKKIGRRENHSRSRSILTAVALFTSLNSFRFISSRFSCAIGINIVLNVIFWLFYLFLRANALSFSLSPTQSVAQATETPNRQEFHKQITNLILSSRCVCEWVSERMCVSFVCVVIFRTFALMTIFAEKWCRWLLLSWNWDLKHLVSKREKMCFSLW